MSDNFKVQVSYKFGAYDEHMINVRGDSTAEVVAQVTALNHSLQEVTDFGALLKGATAATAVTAPTGPAPTSDPAPAAPQGRYCTHGPRTRRTGNSARGAWVGWFCPLAKGHPDQCKAEFED